MPSSARPLLRLEAIEMRRVGVRFQAFARPARVAEEEAKTGRQPASAKTANSTAYLPWPFHTVLNSTLLSKPVGKRNRRVRAGFRRAAHRLFASLTRNVSGLLVLAYSWREPVSAACSVD